MTNGSLSSIWIQDVSFLEKVISYSTVPFSPKSGLVCKPSTVKTWCIYLLRVELVFMPPGKPSYNGVDGVTHMPIFTSHASFLDLLGSRVSRGVAPLGVGAASCLDGAPSGVFFQVAFLDEELNLLFELVEVLFMVTLDLIDLAPRVWFRTHDV